MNPPEKISMPWSDGADERGIITEYEVEYIRSDLAPVWHDAKTDPPKVNGKYPVRFEYLEQWQSWFFKDGVWFLNRSGFDEVDTPDYWMPLPEPPKESVNGDERDLNTLTFVCNGCI